VGNKTAEVTAKQNITQSFGRDFAAEGYSLRLCAFSALDQYWGFPALPFIWAETDAGIPDLARLCEDLRFPGVDMADGAVDFGDGRWYFRCLDAEEPGEAENQPSYGLLSFTQDWDTKRFRDPWGVYSQLRLLRDGKLPTQVAPDSSAPEPWWTGLNPETGRWRAAMDGALILARYGSIETERRDLTEAPVKFPEDMAARIRGLAPDLMPQPEAQRVLLTSLLVSTRPDLGLEFLKATGFVAECWPELAQLDNVEHSKEFHPEGNVWNHTLETFRYRKASSRAAFDLRLSLGLLLHDVGKPLSASSGNRRFDGHAELGARAARRFLERLEFEPSIIDDIFYLVKNHMLPAALPRLPLIRTGEIMENPLFSTLMELYRCDESSSFKGMDGYYESSAAYQAYLRRRRNPYRSADGKKLGKGSL
jgi:poly(A) polymerase